MNFLLQNEDLRQHKTLYQYNLPNDINKVFVTELRYRETDGTLIIVMKEKVEVKNKNS